MEQELRRLTVLFLVEKNAALIENKNFALHNIIYKTPSLYLERNKKPQFLNCQTSLLVPQYIAWIKSNTQTCIFSQNLLITRCKHVWT